MSGVVAIIPARGGSRGIHRKNLRLLAGEPLIGHTIRAAQAATSIDVAFVSTEDEEIAQVAAGYGITVIRRPVELATDTAQNDLVMRHALEAIREQGLKPSAVALLQPTSPLRRAADIDGCIALFAKGAAASCLSMCEVDHHPGKAIILRDGWVEPFTSDVDMEARRQNLPRVYRQNGAIYVVGVSTFIASGRLYQRPCSGFLMSREDSIDIDTEVDLIVAEAILGSRQRT